MMQQKQLLLSKIFELLIPLLLYFLWNWELHFILLFAYIDIIAAIVISYLKERKIELYKTNQIKNAHINLSKNLIFGFLGIVFLELTVLNLYPEIDLSDSWVKFLLFEEMGLPQGVIIFPLIILLNWQQFQMTFIKTNAFQTLPFAFAQQQHRNTWLLFAVSSLFILGIELTLGGKPLLYLFLVVLFKAISDFVLIPYLDKKFVRQFVNSSHDFSRRT